ncbi:MAG: HlyD family secretion protein [Pseudomonadota bacterium]
MLERIKQHAGKVVIAIALLLYLLFEVSTYIFVYSDDAYVATDVVMAAPQVPGTLQALNVARDQEVKEGEVLFLLDQRPFELSVQRYEAAVKVAEADIQAAKDSVGEAQAQIASNKAILEDARKVLARMEALVRRGDVSQQRVDNAQRDFQVAQANLTDAESSLVVSQQAVVQEEANLAVAQAELARAEWGLEQTLVRATSSGRIGPVTAQPGDYIEVGQAVLAVVTDDDWRIVANVRERFLESLKVGETVYFTLGSEPWVWRRGRVRALAAGVARDPGDASVLPYVNPETDWIRIPRRFPVEIDLLGLEKERRLFQGADASILVLF